jgi:hypothetical protein
MVVTCRKWKPRPKFRMSKTINAIPTPLLLGWHCWLDTVEFATLLSG